MGDPTTVMLYVGCGFIIVGLIGVFRYAVKDVTDAQARLEADPDADVLDKLPPSSQSFHKRNIARKKGKRDSA